MKPLTPETPEKALLVVGPPRRFAPQVVYRNVPCFQLPNPPSQTRLPAQAPATAARTRLGNAPGQTLASGYGRAVRVTATLIVTPHCKLIDPCAKPPALSSRAKSTAGIATVRLQFGLTLCSSTLPAQFGHLTHTPRKLPRTMSARQTSPSFTAATPPAEAVVELRHHRGNLAARHHASAAIWQKAYDPKTADLRTPLQSVTPERQQNRVET